ncbi:response regulator receiver domain [Acinetobacter sp. YH12126]|uniref:response regulator receiver domain n=1 Tax=Acinetobacter sp. YH12126 TaxID=2601111 RepID=UPI0015D36100|nr:response regulator receiver domain [Acinetobacter sp. YH12126]
MLDTNVYNELIEEAFIKPIRSVMVIDDEYPTLNSLITNLQTTQDPVGKYKPENLERLKNIIEMCHQKKEWVVDVFDGNTPKLDGENHIPERLRHSDLVILDYHLNGSIDHDGGKARSILNKLDNNNHYNLVLVHTNGLDHNIEEVYNEILCDFIKKPNKHLFELNDDLNDKIEDWLDVNDPNGQLYSFLNINFDIKRIIELISIEEEKDAYFPQKPTNLFNPYANDIKQLTNAIRKDITDLSEKDITQWFGSKVISKLNVTLTGTRNISEVKWCWESDVNYICTDNIFISVIKKNDCPIEEELYGQLYKSLVKLNPSPMFLLLAKIRHYIDEIGLEHANKIANNKYAQAGWLFNLLKNSSKDLSQHEKAIDIHWEQLGRASKPALRDFSIKLCDSLMSLYENDEKKIVQLFFDVNYAHKNDVLSTLNAFSCSIPPCTTHLTTGSILEIENKLWLCLSPSCDLVPGQRQGDWEERIGKNFTVVKAVQLTQEPNIQKANEEANTNNYLFLRDKFGEIKAYYISLGKKNPKWDVFFAHNHGVFDISCPQVRLTCLRKNDGGEDQDSLTNIGLMTKDYTATIVAELRYAYALNFLQKLGANQTRIGLNYSDKFFH